MKAKSIALRRVVRAGWLASPIFLAACAMDQEWDNPRFGESVRHTIALQTTDPDAGAPGLDGEKAENVLRTYRGSTGSPKSVESANVEF